jgi:hypothetical protein
MGIGYVNACTIQLKVRFELKVLNSNGINTEKT